MTPLEQMKADASKCNLAVKKAQGVGLGLTDSPKRTTPEKIISRRKVVYELHMQGVSNTAIAERVGVDRGTVIRDLKAIGGHHG